MTAFLYQRSLIMGQAFNLNVRFEEHWWDAGDSLVETRNDL